MGWWSGDIDFLSGLIDPGEKRLKFTVLHFLLKI
jgi:hypothetical protein